MTFFESQLKMHFWIDKFYFGKTNKNLVCFPSSVAQTVCSDDSGVGLTSPPVCSANTLLLNQTTTKLQLTRPKQKPPKPPNNIESGMNFWP